MDLLSRLRQAQLAQGDLQPLQEVTTTNVPIEKQEKQLRAEEETKETHRPGEMLQVDKYSQFLHQDDQGEAWAEVVDSMYFSHDEEWQDRPSAVSLKLWSIIIKIALSRAERSGDVPLYLRCLFEMRFPLTAEELKL